MPTETRSAPATGEPLPPFTRRVRIATGLTCNLSCKFCYYNDELNTQDYTGEQVHGMLACARDYGIRDIDFSGGEPTLRSDLPQLLSAARELGFRRICMITNATRTHRRDYLEALQAAGLNELLLSLHGHDAASHDQAVDRDGSFARVEATIGHARDLGLRLRTNTVVNRYNADSLVALARYIVGVAPAASNFICFNDWVNASPVIREIAVRYSEVAPQLRAAVATLVPAVSKVTVRYIPFCFLRGYQQHVCGLLQNDYDNDEWNDAVKRAVTDRDPVRLAGYLNRLGEIWREHRNELSAVLCPTEQALLADQDSDNPFISLSPELAESAHKVENFAKRRSYVKGEACASCSHNLICDGLEPAYAGWHGTSELEPYEGPAITDPMHYRRSYARTWR